MPKYVIERHIPGCGSWNAEQLRGVARQSNEVLNAMGPRIQWVHSYVTDDTIYCVYIAPDEDMVRRHAELGGFPANKISKVSAVIDPVTSE